MSTLLRLSLLLAVVSVPAFVGCSVQQAEGSADSEELVGAEEDDGTDGRGAESVVGAVAAGAQLRTTANLNLRNGASTSNKILHVIPSGSLVTVVSGTPKSGWYNIKHGGSTGWSYGVYLDKVSSGDGGGGSATPPPSGGGGSKIDEGIARAKAGVGFSYWWGHGRWLASGATSSNKGSCSGSCPSCSHGGSYGADCSGYVAKIWQVPSSNDQLSDDSHPYYTGNFTSNTSYWSTVSRGSAKRGDAFVYNSGGAGHIFLFESGDGWGSMWAYEAKGCSYGIVRNLRTAGSNYKAIRRTGW